MKFAISRVRCCAAMLALSFGAAETQAAPVVVAKHDNVNHSATTSAFFTLSTDGTTALTGENGWAPTAPTQAAVATAVTTKKTFSFVGNSTSAGNWTDGNGVPTGITLTFDAEFTITALPLGSYLTNPGPNATVNNNIGRGIGVTQTLGSAGINDINQGAGLEFSPVTVSNVSFGGTLAEAGFAFTPGGVSGFGTMLYRSGVFNETIHGMVLTQGTETIGFGLATGTLASNLLMENNFGQYAGTMPALPSSAFPRQSGPYTLVVTEGAGCIKGLTLGYDVTYDISAAGSVVNADFNGDSTVDGADFLVWQRNAGIASGATLQQGDADGDGAVGALDLDAWKTKFGGAATVAVAAVPEPTAALLMGAAVLSIAAVRRR